MSYLILLLSVIAVARGQSIAIGNGTIRFFNNGTTSGTSLSSGIVQVFLNGTWGNICRDKIFGQYAADTICYQMGYAGADSYGSAYENTPFGIDVLDPVMTALDCSSTNYQVITQCSYLPANGNTCANKGDVYVTCNKNNIWTSPFAGMIRLVGGRYSSEGLVEVYCNDQWGTVCDDGIDDDETDTICVQLGYSRAFAWDNLNNIRGNISQPIWFDNLFCGHTDKTCVGYCQSCPSTQGQRCQHSEDLTVQCTYDKLSSNTGSLKNTCKNISKTGLSIGAIIAISVVSVIGSIICGILLIGVPLCLYCRKSNKTYVVFN